MPRLRVDHDDGLAMLRAEVCRRLPKRIVHARGLRRFAVFLAWIVHFGSRFDHQWLRLLAVALTLGTEFLVATVAAHAECNRERVVIFGTSEERKAACRAVTEVGSYFAQAGLNFEFDLTVRFQSHVEITIDNEFAHGTERWPVSAYYRASTNEVYMTRLNAPWTSERTPWNLPWDEEIGFSILEHEIIHAAIAQIMGDKYGKLPHAWHEALAYAIQIGLMKPDLRAKVLANFSTAQAFSSTLEIHDLSYAFDPDAFAVAAYKMYTKNNEIEFVRRAIALELEMTDLRRFLPP